MISTKTAGSSRRSRNTHRAISLGSHSDVAFFGFDPYTPDREEWAEMNSIDPYEYARAGVASIF